MKKNFYYLTILSLFLCFFIFLLKERLVTIEVMQNALTLWRENLFPTLFPFLVLGEIFIALGIPGYLANFLEKPFQKGFHLSGKASFVLFMSLFSGFPSGPKYTRCLYEKKEISLEEANHLLFLVHFSNPLFILGTIYLVLQNRRIPFLILFAHIGSNFLVALVKRKRSSVLGQTTSLKQAWKENITQFSSFGFSFLEAIQSAISTMLFMLGSISFFMLLAKMCTQWIQSPIIKSIFTGIFDLTSGIFSLKSANLSLFLKGMLATIFVTFGGFSVHLQVLNTLKGSMLSYKNFLKGRLLATLFAILLFLLCSILNRSCYF